MGIAFDHHLDVDSVVADLHAHFGCEATRIIEKFCEDHEIAAGSEIPEEYAGRLAGRYAARKTDCACIHCLS